MDYDGVRGLLESMGSFTETRTYDLGRDPVSLVHRFEDRTDREAVGFIAAMMAMGRAGLFIAAVERVLAMLGPHPGSFLVEGLPGLIIDPHWRYRFFDVNQLRLFLEALAGAYRSYGSLEQLIVQRIHRTPEPPPWVGDHRRDVFRGLRSLRDWFIEDTGGIKPIMVPDPYKSAAKRLWMFARWMVRKDSVDLGLWTIFDRSQLVIPLDTHSAQGLEKWGILSRRTLDAKAAVMATDSLAKVVPDDPVMVDFYLVQRGMERIYGSLPVIEE